MSSSAGTLRRLISFAVLAAALGALAAPAASAETIPVNTTADELSNDGNCSLREAIEASNTDRPVDACAVGGIATPSGLSGMPAVGGTLSAGTYYYVVTALNGVGETLPSSEAGVTITATDIISGNDSVKLDWNAVAGATSYRVYRGSSSGGPYQLLNTPTVTTPSFTDDGSASFAFPPTSPPLINTTDTGPDTISLPAGTFHLTQIGAGEDQNATGDLDLNDEVTIEGAGPQQTIIDASGLGERAIDVRATATIAGLTIENGAEPSSGGGILAEQGGGKVLDLSHVALVGNTAGGSGGGVEAMSGTTNLDRVTLSANFASLDGGAIDNQSRVGLANVTVSGNSTDGNGGGLGIYSDATLNNATITNNTANADAGASSSDNGGGISSNQPSGHTVTVSNTIVAGNLVGSGAADPDCANSLGGGTFTSLGHNLVGDLGSCAFGGPGDLIGQPANLGPLAQNGGGLGTHALLSGSAAIDHGGSDCEPTDERGVARPQGPACDIGAFELQVASTIPPASTVPSTTTGPTGERAAALEKCRKQARKKHWPHKKLKKCKEKANQLPL